MRYTISESNLPLFFYVKISGGIDPGKIEIILDEILSDSRWKAGTTLLFDYSEVNMYCFPVSSVDRICKIAEKNMEKLKGSLCGVIVNPLTDKTILSVFETISDKKSNHFVRIFTNTEDAYSWMKDAETNLCNISG